MTDQMNRIIMPDFNNDVMWRPPRLGGKLRSVSTTEEPPKKALDEFRAPRERRTSFTDMFFGGRTQPMSIDRHTSLSTDSEEIILGRSGSLTETRDFKEFVRRQNKILEDQ